MTVDPTVLPGLLLLAGELLALATVGFIVARVALGQTDDRMALAQGMVIGLALWGLVVNFVLHVLPGLVGAVAGWAVVLACGAALAWRTPSALRLRPRTVVGFLGATLALFWVALASRQLLGIPDENIHVALASTIRGGQYPPVLSWTPELPLPYHHGVDLLVGLMTPPAGPGLAFTTEVLGAYVWTGFVLVIATAVLRHGGNSAFVLMPLVLTAGAWTLVWYAEAPDILRVPLPTGVPAPGIRASLSDIYWPSVSLPWTWPGEASPPNIWKPPFVLTYALGFVVLERAAAAAAGPGRSTWPLALLIGFMGLMAEEVALLVLGLWVVLEAARTLRGSPIRKTRLSAALRAAAGPLLAALLLAVGGGVLTSVLTGVEGKEISLGWHANAASRRPLGALDVMPGGVGVLGLGVLSVAGAAAILARRNHLVLALAAGSGVFLLAALVLRYDPAGEVTRMDGHARNFALLALLVALSAGLRVVRPRWRHAAVAGIAALVVWPTVAEPAHRIAPALRRGVHLANAQPNERESNDWLMGRAVIERLRSDRVAAYIRDHTAVDDRVFSPIPHVMTAATGRSNASGFPSHIHLFERTGAEYEDVLRFLEPAAVLRLGFDYVHAPEAWAEGLPNRARDWLRNPDLFELLVRDGADALYRVKPAFPRLNPSPARQSYEALRQTVPHLATVHVPTPTSPLTALRIASVLPHARILGTLDPAIPYSLTDLPTEPIGQRLPDVVIVERDVSFDIGTYDFSPIWWNHAAVAYATRPNVAPAIDPPPQSAHHFSIRVGDPQVTEGQITFSTEFSNNAPGEWTGQDWLLVRLEDSRWGLAADFESDGYTLVGTRWFGGQISPDLGTSTRTYRFDAGHGQLAVQENDGDFIAVPESGNHLTPGTYVLAARLRLEYLQAAMIPVLEVTISESGETTITPFEGERSVSVKACVERLRIATLGGTLCRDRAAKATQTASA